MLLLCENNIFTHPDYVSKTVKLCDIVTQRNNNAWILIYHNQLAPHTLYKSQLQSQRIKIPDHDEISNDSICVWLSCMLNIPFLASLSVRPYIIMTCMLTLLFSFCSNVLDGKTFYLDKNDQNNIKIKRYVRYSDWKQILAT